MTYLLIRVPLETFLCIPGDYLFLLVVIEVNEVIAVACYPYKEPAVVLRMGLCITESILVNNVELDMVSAEFEVGADEILDPFDALFTCKDRREEALVEKRSS